MIGKRGQIPRFDLPYGTLRWQGTSGDRAVRSPVQSGQSGPFNYYKLLMPKWASGLRPEPLSPDEQRAVENRT